MRKLLSRCVYDPRNVISKKKNRNLKLPEQILIRLNSYFHLNLNFNASLDLNLEPRISIRRFITEFVFGHLNLNPNTNTIFMG